MSELGGLVRRHRERLGLTVREAARRIGISPSYLVSLEQGRNPSTGRPPMPSPPVLAALARAYDLELTALLDASGVPSSPSTHVLLYQAGGGFPSPLDAARELFADRVDAWIEFVDQRRNGDIGSSEELVTRRRWQPEIDPGTRFETAWSLDVLAEGLRGAALKPKSRVGVVFGASSAVIRSVENPDALLESEATWEHDVAAECRSALGVEPAANVCVYREADVQELGDRLDPLAAVLSLVQTHSQVAVQDRSGVTIGPAAIETILAPMRPPGVSSGTWGLLTRAAALGLARRP
jgi:transcriptional regulator with XRE-family HTH domain